MNNRQNAYIVFLIIVGFAVLCYSIVQVWLQISNNEITLQDIAVDWLIMLLLFVLCRSLPVYISKDKTIDISFVPVVASTMIFGLYPTIMLFFLSVLFLFVMDENSGKYYYLLSKSPKKELFNMANILTSIFIGGQPLLIIGGYGEDFTFPFSILPTAIFGTLIIASNLILFIIYFVSAGEDRFLSMFSQTILGILPNVISTIPLGIFIALLLNRENGSYVVLLFVLPLLLARYSFKLYLESRSMNMRIIEALSRTIEAKDLYTRGHSQRVAKLAEQTAAYMHLPKKTIADIRVAALLHDIGKIGVEDNILNKPESLTYEEYKEIKKHPVIGSEIIKEIKFSKTINDAVLYHHCWFDGSGYPDNEHEDLPLPAAILGIADAFDAMTSNRPYRCEMTNQEALDILCEYRGSQFDPDVVDAFIKMLESQDSPV